MVEQVTVFRAPTTVADMDAIADWLADRIPATVCVEDRFLDAIDEGDEVAEGFARARVLSPYDRSTGNTMEGIIRYERRVLDDPTRGGGVLYDGSAIQAVLRQHLPGDENGLATLPVIPLDRALATWGDHDGRWHKRISVLGYPALLSVPGLYEAPAKPEAYYRAKQQHALLTGDAPPREVLEQEIEGDFLVADDPRTTDALKGYALQAYHLLETGEAFCTSPECRLYNAHRHGELIRAQLRSPTFCEDHADRYA